MKIRRRVLEPSQLGRRRRRRRNFKITLWAFLIWVLLGGLVIGSHLPQVNISNIQINGNVFASANNIYLLAQKNLSGNYFYLFPKSNFLFFPRNQIKKDILEKFPPIDAVNIASTDLMTIKINVIERKPNSLWCQSENNCYFMDDSGYIFYVAPNYSTNLYFTYSGLIDSTSTNPIGQRYMSYAQFKSINNFIGGVKNLNLDPISLSAVDQNDFELNLKPTGIIRFNAENLTESLSNLATIANQNNPPDERLDLSNIDYIDLRFGNKIYYKLKGGASATSTL